MPVEQDDHWYTDQTPYYADKTAYYDDVTPYYTNSDIDRLHNKTPVDVNYEINIETGGYVKENKATQIETGLGQSEIVTLTNLAFSDSVEIDIYPSSGYGLVQVWLKDVHWQENLNADGYVVSVSPISPARWPTNYTVRLRYSRQS